MKKIWLSAIVLLLMFCLTGCGMEVVSAYTDLADIKTEVDSYDKMARIEIIDTYTKAGVKYYVFTTDISQNKKFTLSEAEYDKYIGLGNNAVDCTVYNLNCYSNVFLYKYFLFPDMDLYNYQSLWDIEDRIEHVNFSGYVNENSVYVYTAYDLVFEHGDYRITCGEDDDYREGDGRIKVVTTELDLNRYSFAGELAFSEEEINKYLQIMNDLNTEMVTQCNEAISTFW